MLRDDGVWVVGRRVLGKEMVFDGPYLLLKRSMQAGDKWEGSVKAGATSQKISIAAGPEEEVKTPAGSFQALRVSFEGDVLAYRRWYARGVGLVREEPVVFPGDKEERINVKLLKKRIE